MKRREFVGLLGAAAATWPLSARAQQSERVARIGYISFVSAARSRRNDDEFRAGLRDLGYVEGRNLLIEFRSAEQDESKIPALVSELIDLKVDVIVTSASGVFAAMRATKTIPIVMVVGPDLVALGLVESLAHPGGNVTGSTFFAAELMSKRLELLKEIAPATTRAGVLLFRREDNANAKIILESMGATAEALKVQLRPVEVS
jgi:putative tryptophan/tyrosine transport system substrate-binding protein